MKKRFLGVVLLCLFSGRLPAQSQTLDPTNFVVLGGGLASGYANFQLVGRFQEKSFPVLMADQMKTIMPMPLFREAPAGVYVSFNPQPDLLPDINQSVLRGLPFPLFTFNLSVPFLRVSESVNRRPAPPFVHEGNLKQTMINLILGYPVLILDTPALWTQVEYAEFMAPTLVIVQLGFGDVLQGAISGDPGQISSSSGFASDYQTIVDRVKGTHATVILMNVPDPVDTAYFTDLESAAAAYQTDSASLMAQFDLEASDRLSLGGPPRGASIGPIRFEGIHRQHRPQRRFVLQLHHRQHRF